jgi:hypothetical protein
LTETDSGFPKNTADMGQQTTYSGWDFGSIWAINSGKNGGYPYLRALPVADPIVISSGTTASALHELLVNNLDGDFILTGTVNLSGYTWKPIGTAAVPFTGTFDGKGNTLSIATLNNTAKDAGFFSFIGTAGIVKNLHVDIAATTATTSNVDSNWEIGAIAGYNRGTIYRCSSSGSITGYDSIGGLVGENHGTIEECWSNATVIAYAQSGGLVGVNGANDNTGPGIIKNCYARGSVTLYEGGSLVGNNNDFGTIINSYAAGPVQSRALGHDKIHVFLGDCTTKPGALTNCYFDSSKIKPADDTIGTVYGTPLTTDEMKDSANFSTNYSGWDLAVWTFTAGKNGGYPCLSYNEATTDVSVSTQAGLDAIRSNLNGDYILSGNVTLSDTWTPIGSSTSPFTGTLDGKGYKIMGLKATNSGEGTGLIGVNKGTIQNLGIEGAEIHGGTAYSGILVGNNYGKLYRCWSSGSVTGKERIGGLTGQNTNGWIEECYSVASVTTTDHTSSASVFNVGGLAGSNDGTIINCYARGAVNGYGLEGVGGLYGYHELYTTQTINCYSTGLVTATNAERGGFCYQAGSQPITNCFYDRETSGQTDTTATPTYTANMLTLTTFSTNWDIVGTADTGHIWGIGAINGTTINNGYPYLQYFGANTVTP